MTFQVGLWYLAGREQQDGRAVRAAVSREEKEEVKWFMSRQYYSFLCYSSRSCLSLPSLHLSLLLSLLFLLSTHPSLSSVSLLPAPRLSLSLYSARVVWLTSLTVSGLQLRFLLKHTLQRVFIVVPLYHPLAFTKQAWVIKLDKRQAMTVFGDKFPQRKYYNCPDPRLHGLQQ